MSDRRQGSDSNRIGCRSTVPRHTGHRRCFRVGQPLTWLGCRFIKCLNRRGQTINGRVPCCLGRVCRYAQSFDQRQLSAVQDIEQQIILTHDFIHVATLENQLAIAPAVGIIKQSLGQMRWQVRKISLTLIGIRLDRRRNHGKTS